MAEVYVNLLSWYNDYQTVIHCYFTLPYQLWRLVSSQDVHHIKDRTVSWVMFLYFLPRVPFIVLPELLLRAVWPMRGKKKFVCLMTFRSYFAVYHVCTRSQLLEKDFACPKHGQQVWKPPSQCSKNWTLCNCHDTISIQNLHVSGIDTANQGEKSLPYLLSWHQFMSIIDCWHQLQEGRILVHNFTTPCWGPTAIHTSWIR